MEINQTNNENKNFAEMMRELSDIKASLAVNTSETQNIKSNISEIKSDMKDIKNDYVSRRELTDAIAGVREEINPLKKFVYGIISIICIAVLGGILSLVLKK